MTTSLGLRYFVRKLPLLLAACIATQCPDCLAREHAVTQLSGTLESLFASEQAASFKDVLPADERVQWAFIEAEPAESPSGVLLFISPNATALPQPDWHTILRERNLHWIAAENFGNEKPTAQRVLVAIMGLRRLELDHTLDRKRIYIGGMSGGGRAASTAITSFPQLFSGALYIVGADTWKRDAHVQLPSIREKRYVFITGRRDFNRSEMRGVYRDYIENGVQNALLMDLRGFGHQYPGAEQLNRALEFLDGEETR